MRLKKKLFEGKTVIGTQITMLSNPQMVWIMKNLGFDYIFVDCEHGGFSNREVSSIVSMSRALEVGVLVRPPQADRQNIQVYADMGIDGLIIPMTESAEEIQNVVRYARFEPDGIRGVAPGPITNFLATPNLGEILRTINEEFLIIAQIETRKGVKNAEEILSVDGVDAVFFGMNDMSVSYGIPGDTKNPMLREQVCEVLEIAKKHHKICGNHFFTHEDLEWGIDQGIRLISWGSDIGVMQRGYCEDIKIIHEKTIID